MKNYDYDVATIMKKNIYGDSIVKYVPLKIAEGYYDEEHQCFRDFDGTPYYHIIDDPESYGFCDRISYSELKKSYPLLNSTLIKTIMLRGEKKFEFLFCENYENKEVPAIICLKNGISEGKLLDGDIIKYYYENYYDFFQEIFSDLVKDEDIEVLIEGEEVSEKDEEKEENKDVDINKLYTEITSRVIDQDEPVKKILTAIWKQTKDFSKNKSRNILINGSTGVGKTEIFRILTKAIDIPCVITSATQYSATGYVGSSVEDMLVSLVMKADGDLEKAQKGILIIDEVDKLSESNKGHSQVNQKDVQESLLKILEDGVLPIKINGLEYQFDTSNLMVIAMGSWSRVELIPEKKIGFGKNEVVQKKTFKDITREDMVENGLISDFVGRFNTIIQMNDLDYESFLKILKTNHGVLNMNKEFLNKQGIKLKINDGAYNAIAKKASKSKFGARDLDSIVETALSVASFEIASNPDKYSELIIDEDTIEDNKKYILVKKLEKEN